MISMIFISCCQRPGQGCGLAGITWRYTDGRGGLPCCGPSDCDELPCWAVDMGRYGIDWINVSL